MEEGYIGIINQTESKMANRPESFIALSASGDAGAMIFGAKEEIGILIDSDGDKIGYTDSSREEVSIRAQAGGSVGITFGKNQSQKEDFYGDYQQSSLIIGPISIERTYAIDDSYHVNQDTYRATTISIGKSIGTQLGAIIGRWGSLTPVKTTEGNIFDNARNRITKRADKIRKFLNPQTRWN
jgi:hypothetical protein